MTTFSRGAVTISDTDPGFAKLISRTAGPGRSSVGYFEDQGNNSNGIPLVMQVAENELGTEDIPSRPAIRRGFDGQKDKTAKDLKILATHIVSGNITKKQALEYVSEDMKKAIKKVMTSGLFIKNAPVTIRRKGFDFPLVRTGMTAGKITHRLSKK